MPGSVCMCIYELCCCCYYYYAMQHTQKLIIFSQVFSHYYIYSLHRKAVKCVQLSKYSLSWSGIIKHGGVKPNIIPDYSELEYYFRTPSHRDLPNLRAKAEACFRAAALATGCEVSAQLYKPSLQDREMIRVNRSRYSWHMAQVKTNVQVKLIFAKNEYSEVLRNRTLEDLYEENGKALGMTFATEGFSGKTIIFWLVVRTFGFNKGS